MFSRLSSQKESREFLATLLYSTTFCSVDNEKVFNEASARIAHSASPRARSPSPRTVHIALALNDQLYPLVVECTNLCFALFSMYL